MANEQFKIRKGPSAGLNTTNVPIVAGQVSIATDTGDVYLDTDSSTRLHLNNHVKKSGDTMTGELSMGANTINTTMTGTTVEGGYNKSVIKASPGTSSTTFLQKRINTKITEDGRVYNNVYTESIDSDGLKVNQINYRVSGSPDPQLTNSTILMNSSGNAVFANDVYVNGQSSGTNNKVATQSPVTQSSNGLMISTDKKKIDESFTNGRKPNTTQGNYSTAIGYPDNEASAQGGITLGSDNKVAVASYSGASSNYGIAIGKSNTVQGGTEGTKNSNYAISLGYNNQSTAQGAISVGMNNTSTRYSSIAIGDGNAANAVKSVSVGVNNSVPYNITVDGTTYKGYASIGIGTNNKSYGEHAIAIGSGSDSSGSETYNLAQGTNTIAIGYANTAKGTGATAIGYDNEVTANRAAALGSANIASGFASVVGGFRNHATGAYTTMFGRGHNYFDDFDSNGLTMVGRYGYIVKRGNYGALADNTQNGDAFIIGAGYADQQEVVEGSATWTCFNAFRVTQNGAVFAHEQNVHGADYAEYVKEWGDGNPTHEDRVGYMVTIKNNKLEKANANDYIIGITSGNPAIVGNSDDEYFWRYETDDFNRIVYEDVEGIVVTTDENGNDVVTKTGEIVKKPKLNQNYNPQLRDSYISRSERPEWDYVGMRGIVPVRDDGTCVAGGFCKCGGNGIATYASEQGFNTYYVIERISENVVSVEVK